MATSLRAELNVANSEVARLTAKSEGLASKLLRITSECRQRRSAAEKECEAIDARREALREAHALAREDLDTSHKSGLVNGTRVTALLDLASAQERLQNARIRLDVQTANEAQLVEMEASNNPFTRFEAWRTREDFEMLKTTVRTLEVSTDLSKGCRHFWCEWVRSQFARSSTVEGS